MKHKTRWMISALLVTVALLLAVGGAVYAQAGGYDLSWWTVDGGGGQSSGGAFTLAGTIGQPDAGSMSGGGYTLAGGFWHAGAAGGTSPGGEGVVYLPLVVKP